MRRLAHISDLHFGAPDQGLVIALEEELDRFNPDLLVVTGDLTEHAGQHEFEQARGFLDGLPFARLVVPGSHDIAPVFHPLARVFNPYGRYVSYFPPVLNSSFADAEMLVIGLNTVHPLRLRDGRISEQQLGWIETLTRRHPSKLHVLAAHHPLVRIDRRSPEQAWRGSQPLLSFLHDAGVDLLLTGEPEEQRHAGDARAFGIRESMLIAQTATETAPQPGDRRHAFNCITLDDVHVRIEVRSLQGGCFVSESAADYERHAGKWRSAA